MPWFFDVTFKGAARANRQGPFGTSQEAEDAKTAFEAEPQDPEDVAGDVYQSSDEAPCPVARFTTREGEKQLWTDGTVEDL